MLIKIAKATEDFLAYVGKYLVSKELATYCDLQTAIGVTEEDVRENPELKDPYTLTTREGSLLTVIDLQGCFEILSDSEFEEMVDMLRVKLSGYMSRPGHSFSIGFERDPERAFDELMRLAEPQLNSARRMGLQVEDVIVDRMRRNAPYVAYEQNLLVVYTHPTVMENEELKRELRVNSEQRIAHKVPAMEHAQNPASVLMALKFRHDTFLKHIEADFSKSGPGGRAGVMLKRLSGHEAIKRIRIMVNRERTSQKFRPVLPGDKVIPHGRADEHDYSDLFAPPICYQICANDVESNRSEMVFTDELWHGNLFMELGPQELQPFARLFDSIEQKLPWRMRMDLAPGGLDGMRGRRMLTSFVGMLPANRGIRDSFAALEERSRQEPTCIMRVTFSTWAKSEDELRRRLASLDKSIQAWGVCQVTGMRGDPLAAWASTIAGFSVKSVANRLVPPLSDALYMMPLQRPATPWAGGGSMIQRTQDGKIFPVQLASRLQDTSIELTAAPPGSGKSVLGNTQNMSMVLSPGNVRLPLIAVVDVGPSSKGLVDLIRDALPDNRKEEAVYIMLQNDKRFAANPFDLQLGARYPTVVERNFLANFLAQMCVDTSTATIPGGVAGVCGELINLAYADRAGTGANLYEESIEPLVDQALLDTGLKVRHDATWWEAATWYEVADMLFAAGRVRESALAHRQAVPVLSDIVSYLNAEAVQRYDDARVGSGESLLKYVYRCLTDAISNYAVFSGRTRFELSSATRVVALNLNNVMGGKTAEGYARTTLMYMFAMNIATKNYFLDKETLLPVIPSIYEQYHMARIADVADELKALVMDEFHNTGSDGQGQDGLVDTVVKLGREGRKWNIRISLISQYLSDFPPTLLDAATSVYVMRGGQAGDERVLKERFDVDGEAIKRLRQEARGPLPAGGNYLAIFKTKVGKIVQILTNTVGPTEMWAFSTTPADMALRARLYEAIGPYEARRLLAERFPSGSAAAAVEYRKQTSAGDGQQVSIVEQLANELLDEYYRQQTRELAA
ncbi:conjugal transfer protein TraU [Bordetella pseudohinzii]|nr:conjugal transfer protein TraU [Bordetella pseudohinzii]ANY18523.1 conjugal transfer protein TraU [Bordetella pseudohinzii]KMM24075.1 conjugal transfer protein TraU [Bordetella pseudohinzii]KXA77890.1 conjugal transfer protein TraU [Bordetella pseudohinzii]KXA78085.1 conjugal transfer protein TraU [Bordetella pseudohinzii]